MLKNNLFKKNNLFLFLIFIFIFIYKKNLILAADKKSKLIFNTDIEHIIDINDYNSEYIPDINDSIKKNLYNEYDDYYQLLKEIILKTINTITNINLMFFEKNEDKVIIYKIENFFNNSIASCKNKKNDEIIDDKIKKLDYKYNSLQLLKDSETLFSLILYGCWQDLCFQYLKIFSLTSSESVGIISHNILELL
ncbi:hypothetical protein [Candidatus Phytoplasma sacchari]|uniref:Uncharacterized protein n=1 Tax=Candidatus Phytoplasma sacchari TaxID=2609813 RepID=A0ABY7M1P8_9MOLU|nr:hypothetical protein O7R10_00785 [Candidatus Phytoplasma sacchari]